MGLRLPLALALLVAAAAAATEQNPGAITAAQRDWLLQVSRTGKIPADAWPELSSPQRAAVGVKAELYLDTFLRNHFWHDLSVDVYFTDASRTKIGTYDDVGDSACWSGHALAGCVVHLRAHPAPPMRLAHGNAG